jgi:flavodoxin
MSDTLVVYFSRTGYTRRVAEHMARMMGADCEPIRERKARRGWLGYWRSAREAMRGRRIEIEPATLQPRNYSMVVLGTPVWAGNVSSPMRAYIAKHRAEFRSVALFCTQGGSGAPRVLEMMAALCGQSPRATTFFDDAEIDAVRHTGKIAAFTAALARRKAA